MTPAEQEGQGVSVDTEFLAKCLGLEKWPEWGFRGAEPGPAYLGNWRLQYAARVITDAFRPNAISNKVTADIAIQNAEAWITRAYDKGRQAGIQQEREGWRRRIMRVFEI